MSDVDNFIDEVTEEVQRDKLFAAFRKYGWIGVVGVFAIVGGAAYNEVRTSKAQAAAEAAGDALIAVIDAPDAEARAAALALVPDGGEAAAVKALLMADVPEGGDTAAAESALAALAANEALPKVYRDMAVIKRVSLPGGAMPPAERLELVTPLLSGSAFRLLAEEQVALAKLELGDTEGALAGLRALLEDAEAGEGLIRRAEQLIVALGGEIDQDTASE